MKTVIVTAIFVCLSAGFGVCSEQDSDKTIDYYMSHADEREAVLKDCENRYGEARYAVGDCALAFAAKQQSAAVGAVEEALKKLKHGQGQ